MQSFSSVRFWQCSTANKPLEKTMLNSARIKRELDLVGPRVLIWIAQILIFISCGIAAFLLRFEFSLHHTTLAHMYWALAIWLVTKCLTFGVFQLDRGTWRFASVP